MKKAEPIASVAEAPQFAAFIGIDWADRKHVWCLQEAGSHQRETGELEHTAEAVDAWVGQLCQRFAPRPIAVALEQSRGALVFLLGKYEQLHLYPVLSQTVAKMRQALYPSRAKDDPRDADLILDLLQQGKYLRRLSPDTEATRLVQGWVEERRKLVDDRTALSNRLTAKLKIYFPQMLDWFPGLDSAVAYALLERWPSLVQMQQVPPGRLRSFLHKHHCYQDNIIQRRIQQIREATPVLGDQAVVQVQTGTVQALAKVLQALNAGITALEREIQKATAAHPDFSLFVDLPGAGEVLAPRLLAAFGSQRERYQSAAEISSFSGIAPVTESSGKKHWVHCRRACPKFLRQTFHEWAGQTVKFCPWARAYYQRQRDRGKAHHAAVRALAAKWIRILHRCWKARVPYDESIYLAALARRHSPLGATAPVKTLCK